MNRSRFTTRRRRVRRGMATIDAVLLIGSVFVVAMLLYWVGQAGFVGLYQIQSSHIGSPYM